MFFIKLNYDIVIYFEKSVTALQKSRWCIRKFLGISKVPKTWKSIF